MRLILLLLTVALTFHIATASSHAAPVPSVQRSSHVELGVTQQAYVNLEGLAVFGAIMTGVLATPSLVAIVGNMTVLAKAKTSPAAKMGWGVTGVIVGSLTTVLGVALFSNASSPSSMALPLIFGGLGVSSVALGAINIHRARKVPSDHALRGLTLHNQPPTGTRRGFAFVAGGR